MGNSEVPEPVLVISIRYWCGSKGAWQIVYLPSGLIARTLSSKVFMFVLIGMPHAVTERHHEVNENDALRPFFVETELLE